MPTMDEMFERRAEFAHGFGRTEQARAHSARTIQKMRLMHGTGPEDKRCRDCVHLVVRSFAKDYPKCRLFSTSGSATTDWRRTWPTCGKFEAKR